MAYNAGNEHALFKLNASFQILWIKEKLSGKASTICAGFNDDVFIVPEYPTCNYVLQFDASGTILGNHLTKSSVGADNKYGAIQCIKKDDCGFLISNDKSMIAHANKQMVYCMDSSTTLSASYYTVSTHTRANVSLMSSAITSLNEYVMTSTFTSSVSTYTSDCDATYSCNGSTNIENTLLNDITYYPNPVHDMLYIKGLSAYTLQLCDMRGNIVKLIKATEKETSISVADVAAGIYLLKIVTAYEVAVQKITIAH